MTSSNAPLGASPNPVRTVVLTKNPTPADPATPADRYKALLPMLEPEQFTAVGVVHGEGPDATRAWDLLKKRLTTKQGAVWAQSQDLLQQLTGSDASRIQEAFAATPGMLMTFLAVSTERVNWGLAVGMVNKMNIDTSMNAAEGDL